MKKKISILMTVLLLVLSITACGNSEEQQIKDQLKKAATKAAEIGQSYLDYEINASEADAQLDDIIMPESPVTQDIENNIFMLQSGIKNGKYDRVQEYTDKLKNYDIDKEWKFYTEVLGYDEKGNNPNKPEDGTLEAIEFWLSAANEYAKLEEDVLLKNGTTRYKYYINDSFYGTCTIYVALHEDNSIAGITISAIPEETTQDQLEAAAHLVIAGLGFEIDTNIVTAELSYQKNGYGETKIGNYTIGILDQEDQRIYVIDDGTFMTN